jgi:hypothetical protein
MTKDRKFDYLLNVEECLDLILYGEDIKELRRWFVSNHTLYKLVMRREEEKIIFTCEENTQVSIDGHTEITYV